MSAEEEQIQEQVNEIVGSIAPIVEEMRVEYAALVDAERRHIPEATTELERERLKDPYLLSFLGLEPREGDPTIEELERELEDGDG